ncbi:MAG: hypothetical protein ACOCWZ_09960 [Spirochaetota bacterium]
MLKRNAVYFVTILTTIFTCGVIIAASSQVIPQKMMDIVKDAVAQMQTIERDEKGLEKQAQNAIMNNDSKHYTMLAEKNKKIVAKKNKLRQETLVKLNNIIDDGITVPVVQKGYKDMFTIKEAVIKKAVWNPGQSPHVTIEMPVALKRKLKTGERKFHVDFFDGSEKNITRVNFYLGAGTFIFKTGKNQVVSLFANPNIPELFGVKYGILTNE